LPVDDLLAIVDGRMRDFDLRPFADIAELEGYAQAIGGRLGGLLMRALGEQGEAEQAAAYGIGVAWALVGLLRSALQLAREGRSVLPGLEAEEVLANDQVAREVSRKVSERAKIHLNNSRLQIKRAYRPALLLAVPARDFLHILQRNDYNLADQRLHLIKRSAPLRMLLAAWLGKI
jgi:phytoene/squalene synthetase